MATKRDKPHHESKPAVTKVSGPESFAHQEVMAGKDGLLPSVTGSLEPGEIEALWELFQQVGRIWNNAFNDSAGQRSSWLEFVTLRCLEEPSYLEEYHSAIRVIQELIQEHGLVDGYRRLLLNEELSQATKKREGIKTRLHHAKVYVVDEFIRMQVVAGGFRGFGGNNRAYNYNGFVRGTRYNRVQRVRTYRPNNDDNARRDPS